MTPPRPAEKLAPGARNALLLAAFWLVAMSLYWPALDGAFFSDDQHYVSDNAYVQRLGPSDVLAIWNPFSGVSEIVENYAPVHLTVHGLAWQIFGSEVRGHHVLNVSLHALAAWLLVLVAVRFGLSWAASALLGALFLCHPANVEAVAWISQLKTPSSMVLALLAVLAHPRRPALALALFVLALLAKPTAAFALPVLAIAGAIGVAGPKKHWRWMAAWTAAFGLFAILEFAAFAETAGSAPVLYSEPLDRLRSIFAVAARYALMAVSGRGLSLFHEPPPAASWLDPWFLAGLVLLVLLVLRFAHALRMRRSESAFWGWALISYAPVCGLIPLPFPMADRYLYFILPGLLGGAAFALRSLRAVSSARRIATIEGWRSLAFALCAALVVVYAVQARGRAAVWTSANRLMLDAASHYPEGMAAHTLRARKHALAGDARATVAELRAAMARGWGRLDQLLQDPAYRAVHSDAAFRALVEELARGLIERTRTRARASQVDLRVAAQAHLLLEELTGAVELYERAVAAGGPLTEACRAELAQVKSRLRARERLEARRPESR